jgi:hypothetical protein
MLAEARARAAAVLEEAHGKASIAAEASLTGPIPGQDSDRRELEAEVAYLRTYSDVYRTHLHTYLDTLLRNVEEWERAEKQTLAAVRGDTPPELGALPDVPAPSPPPPLPSPPQAPESRGLGVPGRADQPEFGRP